MIIRLPKGMTIEPILNSIAMIISLAVIASKFMDCYTTIKYMWTSSAETNKIARDLMNRYGFKTLLGESLH